MRRASGDSWPLTCATNTTPILDSPTAAKSGRSSTVRSPHDHMSNRVVTHHDLLSQSLSFSLFCSVHQLAQASAARFYRRPGDGIQARRGRRESSICHGLRLQPYGHLLVCCSPAPDRAAHWYELLRYTVITLVSAYLESLPEPYKRYAEEANWGDVVKMMQTIDRHTRLLMDEPVEGTDEEFCAHIKSNARPMPIGTTTSTSRPSFLFPLMSHRLHPHQHNITCCGCTTATSWASIDRRLKSGSTHPRSSPTSASLRRKSVRTPTPHAPRHTVVCELC